MKLKPIWRSTFLTKYSTQTQQLLTNVHFLMTNDVFSWFFLSYEGLKWITNDYICSEAWGFLRVQQTQSFGILTQTSFFIRIGEDNLQTKTQIVRRLKPFFLWCVWKGWWCKSSDDLVTCEWNHFAKVRLLLSPQRFGVFYSGLCFSMIRIFRQRFFYDTFSHTKPIDYEVIFTMLRNSYRAIVFANFLRHSTNR